MEAIKINLALDDKKSKAFQPLFLLLLAFLAILFVSYYNIHLYLANERELSESNKKIIQLEARLARENHPQNVEIKAISKEESESLKERASLINSLIIQDIFPWQHILDTLEQNMPDGLILQNILPASDFKSLTLKGNAKSTKEIFLFLKKLEDSDLFKKSVLARLTADPKYLDNAPQEIEKIEKEAGEKLQFQIENTLNPESLFDEKIYGSAGKNFFKPESTVKK